MATINKDALNKWHNRLGHVRRLVIPPSSLTAPEVTLSADDLLRFQHAYAKVYELETACIERHNSAQKDTQIWPKEQCYEFLTLHNALIRAYSALLHAPAME